MTTFLCLLLFPFLSEARELAGPESFIETMDNKIKCLLNLEAPHKWDEIRDLVSKSLAKKMIAKFVLQNYAKLVSREDMERFVEDYGTYLIDLYIDRLTQYRGEMCVKGLKEVSKDRYLVDTIVELKGGKSVNMSYLLIHLDGSYYVLDIVVGGVRLVFTCRDEVKQSIEQVGLEQFLHNMHNRSSNSTSKL